MNSYLLTGATGAVGSAVLAALLKNPDVQVHALVRADSTAMAEERLIRSLAALGANTSFPNARLIAVVGDVTKPGLGVTTKEYANLVAACSHVIHCAGAVKMNLPISEARLSAGGALGNVLEFCRRIADKGRLIKAEMVSTVGVAGKTHKLLREDWVSSGHEFHNTYELAKAEAEQLLREAIEAGLPLSVHRPSMVVGDSRSGRAAHFQVFYFLVEFLSGRRTFGLTPSLTGAALDIVPVDFVAEAIVRASKSPVVRGKILHLCAGPDGSLPLRSLHDAIWAYLVRCGEQPRRPRYLPLSLFRAVVAALALIADRKSRHRLRTLPAFLDYLSTRQAFDNARTVVWLRETGMQIPRVHEYLPRLLDYYFRGVNECSSRKRRGPLE